MTNGNAAALAQPAANARSKLDKTTAHEKGAIPRACFVPRSRGSARGRRIARAVVGGVDPEAVGGVDGPGGGFLCWLLEGVFGAAFRDRRAGGDACRDCVFVPGHPCLSLF